MPSSYHQWLTYLKSPRAWAFQQMGYRSYPKPGPMTIGTLAHKLIAGYMEHPEADLKAICLTEEAKMVAISQGRWSYQDHKDLVSNAKDALGLAQRYTQSYAQELTPLHVEKEFIHEGVVIHPDLIAHKMDRFIIVDYKTTSRPNPDPGQYTGSFQLDLYAYVLRELGYHSDPLLAYHILSNTGDKGIFPIEFQPRWEAAESVYEQIMDLSVRDPSLVLRYVPNLRPREVAWTDYWPMERLYMEDGLEAALDWGDQNMQKEVVEDDRPTAHQDT